MKISLLLSVSGALLAAAGPVQYKACLPASSLSAEACVSSCDDFLTAGSDPEQVSIFFCPFF